MKEEARDKQLAGFIYTGKYKRVKFGNFLETVVFASALVTFPTKLLRIKFKSRFRNANYDFRTI